MYETQAQPAPSSPPKRANVAWVVEPLPNNDLQVRETMSDPQGLKVINFPAAIEPKSQRRAADRLAQYLNNAGIVP